jgi:hypothetical protein
MYIYIAFRGFIILLLIDFSDIYLLLIVYNFDLI